nr:immunoglobulin heavy chain junction region [Macaca mulatta]MOV54767.1 immunoglobulin heavy chain junction region [Macaca mulatta]MOV54991.1 immunoglobulin heavy chain junction region [Macaca mulatta]MOV55174.1 immunoglobulin heavy chain junction region [Macaca mulatta]MOV56843.1 immunoglobulin heavy chain junction region [Macaca mulatta]
CTRFSRDYYAHFDYW